MVTPFRPFTARLRVALASVTLRGYALAIYMHTHFIHISFTLLNLTYRSCHGLAPINPPEALLYLFLCVP